MVRRLRRNRRVLKKTGEKLQAGKTESATSKKDLEAESNQQNKKDLTEVVKKLQEVYGPTPEKLDILIKGENRYGQVLGDLESRISEISKILSPGRDVIARGLAQKLNTVERNKLLLERDQLDSMKQKLEGSYQKISVKLIDHANNERQAIRQDNLREKVKDPNYYKRYGKDIAPAFERMLKKPMTEIVFNGLLELKGITEDPEFNSFLGKFLLWNNIALYIRSTGNPEAKLKYFAEFRTILIDWDPEKAVIKKDNKKQ